MDNCVITIVLYINLNNHLLPFTVRFEEQIDQSNTVKFVFIHWIGKQTPFTMKGRYGVVYGSAQKNFQVIYCLSLPNKNPLNCTNRPLSVLTFFKIL